MSSYKKYSKYLIAVIITISLGANIFFAIQLRALRQKVTCSNIVTSIKLESAIRDTMYSIKELSKKDSEETMNNLQLSVQQLFLIFNNWVDLNQSEENPKKSLQNGLSTLETLRNTIVFHLENQYDNNGRQLTNYDVVFLNNVYEKLDKLLVVYGNIEKHTDKVKNIDDKSDGGLCQWAANMDEVSKLYRHSRIPNEHPRYIKLGSVLTKIDELFPIFGDFQGFREVNESVQIRDGVHYYEISYFHGDELDYLVWMDAIDGSLRLFEDHTGNHNERIVLKNEALNIAKNFMNEIETYSEVIDNGLIITDEGSKNTVYAFQFIPISGDATVVSDCINVNVSSKGGNIIRYSSNFSNTEVPDIGLTMALEDIEEKYKKEFADMEYNGLSVVRSFYTHYRPVVTYNYKSVEKDSTTELYFDIATGNQVYESYSVYEPISYVSAEDCY